MNDPEAAPAALVAGLLLPLAAVALAVAGLLIPVPGGISALAAVTAGLIITWALCGAATAWARERTPQWQQAAGAVAAAVAFGAGRCPPGTFPGRRHHLAVAVGVLAGARWWRSRSTCCWRCPTAGSPRRAGGPAPV